MFVKDFQILRWKIKYKCKL